jgi:hypothetical protein
MEAVGIPPLEDHNAWADYWYYTIGINPIPVIPRLRTGKKGYDWKDWQLKSLPEDLFKKWKNENAYADGIGVLVGKVWRGDHTGEYFIFVDLDNLRAIEEFCEKDGRKGLTLKDFGDKFLIEQHLDNTSKAHVFFFAKAAFPKKSSDVNRIDDPKVFEDNRLPALEIKGRGTHGISFSSPSFHKHGHRYQIVSNCAIPITLDEHAAEEMKQHLDSICRKYDLPYLALENSDGKSLVPIADLFKDDFVILENHNRHEALLRVIESLIKRNYGILQPADIRKIAYEWNQKHCKPPLDDKEFEKQWRDGAKWILPKIKEEESKQEEEHKQVLELTEDLTKEVTLQDIAKILSTSIKKDETAKLITFCGMLLAQTNEDQINTGFQSESAAGKSYVPVEVAQYFPENEVMKVAAASPTAFYHRSGKWDDAKKAIICDLEHKIIIFLDMPHFQLLERLRPMLSHDDKELNYMITDKNKSGAIRTKNIILRGFPSVFFCTTKQDPDEQEKTRLISLSPSVDQEKLDESIRLATLRKGNPDEYQRRIMRDPQRLWLMQRILGIRQGAVREVVIPNDGEAVYTRFKRDHPYLQPRNQRDFPRIFSLIKACALLNCFNREKVEGRPDTIIATQTDIDAGFDLYKEIEFSNELGLSPHIFKIYVDVIAPLMAHDGIGKGVSREEIMRKYYEVRYKPLSPETLKREILPQLEVVGLIQQEPDPEDKRKMLVVPTVSTPIISAKLAENQTQMSNYYERNRGEDSGYNEGSK